MKITIIKIRRFHDRLIFVSEIPYLERLSLYWDEAQDFIWSMSYSVQNSVPDSKVHGANMGTIWGRQDPGGPHVGPMNLAIRCYIGLRPNVSAMLLTGIAKFTSVQKWKLFTGFHIID